MTLTMFKVWLSSSLIVPLESLAGRYSYRSGSDTALSAWMKISLLIILNSVRALKLLIRCPGRFGVDVAVSQVSTASYWTSRTFFRRSCWGIVSAISRQ